MFRHFHREFHAMTFTSRSQTLDYRPLFPWWSLHPQVWSTWRVLQVPRTNFWSMWPTTILMAVCTVPRPARQFIGETPLSYILYSIKVRFLSSCRSELILSGCRMVTWHPSPMVWELRTRFALKIPSWITEQDMSMTCSLSYQSRTCNLVPLSFCKGFLQVLCPWTTIVWAHSTLLMFNKTTMRIVGTGCCDPENDLSCAVIITEPKEYEKATCLLLSLILKGDGLLILQQISYNTLIASWM